MKPVRFACLVTLVIGQASGNERQTTLEGAYTATAYCQKGVTASGAYTHRHVVAADPDILPIGTRIKIKHAGKYSGEYVVADTGDMIQGRRLDIFVPSERDCRTFGRMRVKIRVIEIGNGTSKATHKAELQVKEDVKKDLAVKAVGNAATEQDWAVKKAAESRGVPPERADELASNLAGPHIRPPAETASK